MQEQFREGGPQRFNIAEEGRSSTSRVQRMRFPEPKAWMITPLKDKDDAFGSWRENFELQIGGTWLQMEKVFLMIRDHPEPITMTIYNEFVKTSGIMVGQEFNEADWNFAFVSKKIYMLLHNYGDVGVRKILVESPDRCGLEAYRLLNKAFVPVNEDLEFSLQQAVTAICNWPTKSVHDELAAFREATRSREKCARAALRGLLGCG